MPDQIKNVRLHATVSGHVQGVGFRAFVLDQALRLGVRGWVRNRLVDEVEILAEGSQAVLLDFLGVVKQGPRMSFIADVTTDWQAATGEFASFQVVRSG